MAILVNKLKESIDPKQRIEVGMYFRNSINEKIFIVVKTSSGTMELFSINDGTLWDDNDFSDFTIHEMQDLEGLDLIKINSITVE